MFVSIIVMLFIVIVVYLLKVYTTFWRAGVNCLVPLPFFGNVLRVLLKKEHVVISTTRAISTFPEDKVIGFYGTLVPVYLVNDIEIVKNIATKDFEHFVNRRNVCSKFEPVMGRSLINLKDDEWKAMRSTLSPVFTGSKIRLMVPFMVEIGEEMNKNLGKKIRDSKEDYIDLDLKGLTTRYANDVIASCAFGLKVDSQSADNNFYLAAQEIKIFSGFRIFKAFLYRACPVLVDIMGLTLVPPATAKFFTDVVLATMKDREERNIARPDMIHLLLQIKHGRLLQEKEVDVNAGFATVDESAVGKKQTNREWSNHDLVSQAGLFLAAGFDTVSSAIASTLYELAINPDVQEKLVEEIKRHDSQNNGKFDFNSVQSMKYLDMIVSEGLRKYPGIVIPDRTCTKDYNLGRVNKTAKKDLILRKGDGIIIPIWTFHHNPKFFPDPEKFDPERFSEVNRKTIKPFTYMPFGVGARNCIASRFALVEMKVMLYQLLREMKLTPCERTTIPPQLAGGFPMDLKHGAWVRLQIRE